MGFIEAPLGLTCVATFPFPFLRKCTDVTHENKTMFWGLGSNTSDGIRISEDVWWRHFDYSRFSEYLEVVANSI